MGHRCPDEMASWRLIAYLDDGLTVSRWQCPECFRDIVIVIQRDPPLL